MPTTLNPLQQLRDIHMPPPLSLWPLAPGWWIVCGLGIAAIATGIWLWRRYQRKRFARKFALRQLEHLQARQATLESTRLITMLAQLLRRLALAYYPPEQIAPLYGHSWLTFLDKTGKTDQFTQGVGHILESGPYQKHCTANFPALFIVVKRWIARQPQYKVGVTSSTRT